MALIERLSEEEIALLEVIEDPVLCGEFLRNTADGSTIKDEWPPQKFAYRWYQRDILTDKSENIVWRAGRAVGKCQPETSRIYTTFGYQTIYDLINSPNKVFGVYAFNEETGEFEERRAKLEYDSTQQVHRFHFKSGFTLDVTSEHPIYTQRGWVEAQNIDITHDMFAVVNKLPWNYGQNIFNWFELRLMGYYASGLQTFSPESQIALRFEQQVVEFEAIAKHFGSQVECVDRRFYTLKRKRHELFGRSLPRIIFHEALNNPKIHRYPLHEVPDMVMRERLENTKIFLEAYFSNNSLFEKSKIIIRTYYPETTADIRELLLRFGISVDTINYVDEVPDILKEHDARDHVGSGKKYPRKNRYVLEINDMGMMTKFYNTFTIPGIAVKNLPKVLEAPDEPYHFEHATAREIMADRRTYALFVYGLHNYISSDVITHNSLTLEDMIVWETLNQDFVFPATKEQLLMTANVNQLTPILDRITQRFGNGELLKNYLPSINRSKGTIDFPTGSKIYRINARIAGSNGESNVVGQHVNKLKVDECQLFPWAAYSQVLPAINRWEPDHRMLFTGVPTGASVGNVLWYLDQKATGFKKYRIPAHENPYFSYEDNIEALRQYGGEDSDEYKQLILGQHGSPTFTVIPRDKMLLEPYDMYSYRYNQTDKQEFRGFKEKLKLPEIDTEAYAQAVVFAIDTGYADPTVIQVFGFGKDSRWRLLTRYRLTRIPFPEQADIIDYLSEYWTPIGIGIDVGAGGQGIALMQDMLSERFDKSRRYPERIHPVRFNDVVEAGEDQEGNPLKYILKTWAGQQLAKLVGEHELCFSELDQEGISQLERVAFTRRADGTMKFFVQSERGQGEADDDHIFASFVVFVAILQRLQMVKPKKRKLFTGRWVK